MKKVGGTFSSVSCFSGKRKFEAFVLGQPTREQSMLPLTHLTDAYDLREILECEKLEPRLCSVFGEDLLYLFYGRPAYRKNAGTQANSLAAYAPIVFLVSAETFAQAEVMFPFDSGAFKGEKYEEFIHHRMRVEDFGVRPSNDAVSRMVSTFFGDNKMYYDQTPAVRPRIAPSQFEAEAYCELVHYKGKNSRDDRASTMEVVFRSAIQLKGNLLAIIVPSSILEDGLFRDGLNELNSDVLTYIDGANLSPASVIPRLQDVVRSYYFRKEIFKK